MRIKNANWYSKLLTYDPDRLQEIRVVCHNRSRLVLFLVSVIDEMSSNVDIGAFLFRFDDSYEPWAIWRRLRQCHHDVMGQESTKDDFDIGEGPQGSKIDLLASWLIGIVVTSTHTSGKVLDLANLVARKEP